jgi:hypothetical protein
MREASEAQTVWGTTLASAVCAACASAFSRSMPRCDFDSFACATRCRQDQDLFLTSLLLVLKANWKQ